MFVPSHGLTQSSTDQKTGASLDINAADLVASTRKTNPGPQIKFPRLMVNLTIGPLMSVKSKTFGPLVYNYSRKDNLGNFVYELDQHNFDTTLEVSERPPQALTITNKELKSLNRQDTSGFKLMDNLNHNLSIYLTDIIALKY